MKFYRVVFSVDGSIKRWERFVFAESEEDAKTIIKKYYSDCHNFDFSEIQEMEIKNSNQYINYHYEDNLLKNIFLKYISYHYKGNLLKNIFLKNKNGN